MCTLVWYLHIDVCPEATRKPVYTKARLYIYVQVPWSYTCEWMHVYEARMQYWNFCVTQETLDK